MPLERRSIWISIRLDRAESNKPYRGLYPYPPPSAFAWDLFKPHGQARVVATFAQYRHVLATPVFQGIGLKRGEEAQQAWLVGHLQAEGHRTG